MRIVPLTDSLEGEVLARSIHTAGGQTLVAAGVTLTGPLITALKNRGLTRVAIRDWLLDDVEIDDAICEETRGQATRTVSATLKRISSGQMADIDQLTTVVDTIIKEVQSRPNAVFSLSALRCHDDYTFVHSVNVCVLSAITGLAVGHRRDQLVELGLGAMLHDLGKIRIPQRTLGKPGPLDEVEWKQVQNHPVEGYHLLVRHVGASYVASHAALDHHERLNGSGYPRSVKGEDITLVGRLVAIADVYDAVTSDRAYRSRMPSNVAIQYLESTKGILFDAELVDLFRQRIALYPLGTVTRLNTGAVAVVIGNRASQQERPQIRIITDEHLHLIPPRDLALVDHPELEITEVLEDYPPQVKRQLCLVQKVYV